MRSSTSSSDRDAARQRRYLALGVGTFVVLLALACVGWRLSPLRDRRVLAARLPHGIPAGQYLAYAGGVLDHHAIFHGLYGIHERLRRADTLVLGTSRVVHAFPERVVAPLAERYGLTPYVLAFGYREGCTLPLMLIRELDLHPRLVIVNADEFFVPGLSWVGQDTVRRSAFDAWKMQLEGRAALAVESRLHRVVPHLSALRRDRADWIIYRSIADGTSSIVVSQDLPAPVVDEGATGGPVPEEDLRLAEELAHEVQNRGARLVLTYVPSGTDSRWRAEAIARHLGVPLVAPRLPGLTTSDGSHLDAESTDRFGAALLDALDGVLREPPSRH